MVLRAEIWQLVGGATFERVVQGPDFVTWTFTKRAGIGQFSATVPTGWRDLRRVIHRDLDNSLNDDFTILRVYNANNLQEGAEFLIERIEDAAIGSGQFTISGRSLEAVMDWAVVAPEDWDGSNPFESLAPDWTWGGEQLLKNPNMEYAVYAPAAASWYIDPAGTPVGDFRIEVEADDGFFALVDVAWNATAAALEAELLTAGFTAVEVSGDGTPTAPWTVEVRQPRITHANWTISDVGALANGTIVMVSEFRGVQEPTHWRKSQTPGGQLHGAYDEFSRSDTFAHQGTYSVRVNPDTVDPAGFPGVEQIVGVRSGALYRASIWVRHEGTGFPNRFFRLVIRDAAGEEQIAETELTIPEDTWTEMTLDDIRIPVDVESVIFRIACVNAPDDIPNWYVDEARFREGYPPSTAGTIVGQLLADAQSDHIGDGRSVIDFVNPTFDDAIDSAGVAWDELLEMTVNHGTTYTQVLEQLANLGYEWAVASQAGNTGEVLLHLWNPLGRGDDLSGDPEGKILLGSILGGPVVVTPPQANALWLEDQEGTLVYSTYPDSAVTARNRETFINAGEDIRDTAHAKRAARELAVRVQAGVAVQLRLPGDTSSTPLANFDIGDYLNVDLRGSPSGENKERRVVAVTFTQDSQRPGGEWVVAFDGEQFTGMAAVVEGVRQLLRRRPPRGTSRPVDQFASTSASVISAGGTPGTPTIVLAASDASESSKGRADIICDGIDDQNYFKQAFALMPSGPAAPRGRLVLTEGTYWFSAMLLPILNAPRLTIEGMGPLATTVHWVTEPGFTVEIGYMHNLYFDFTGGGFGTPLRIQQVTGCRVDSVSGIQIGTDTTVQAPGLADSCLFNAEVSLFATQTSQNQVAAMRNCRVNSTTGTCITTQATVDVGNPVQATVEGCTVNATTGEGIRCSGGNVVIRGNHVRLNFPSSSGYNGISVASNQKCVVEGNTVLVVAGASSTGIWVQTAFGSGSGGIHRVVNNDVINTVAACDGIWFGVNGATGNLDEFTVLGNRVEAVRHGMWVRGGVFTANVRRNTFIGNIVTGGTSGIRFGELPAGTIINNLISGNIVTAPIGIQAVAGATITGNLIHGNRLIAATPTSGWTGADLIADNL